MGLSHQRKPVITSHRRFTMSSFDAVTRVYASMDDDNRIRLLALFLLQVSLLPRGWSVAEHQPELLFRRMMAINEINHVVLGKILSINREGSKSGDETIWRAVSHEANRVGM